MKQIIAVCLGALFWSLTWAQENPTEVTVEQIENYQRGIEAGCKDAGTRRGDPVEKVNGFCDCVLEVLVTELTRAEWQRAYFASIKRDPQAEQEVLAPHMQKVQACRSAP